MNFLKKENIKFLLSSLGLLVFLGIVGPQVNYSMFVFVLVFAIWIYEVLKENYTMTDAMKEMLYFFIPLILFFYKGHQYFETVKIGANVQETVIAFGAFVVILMMNTYGFYLLDHNHKKYKKAKEIE